MPADGDAGVFPPELPPKLWSMHQMKGAPENESVSSQIGLTSAQAAT